MLPVIAPLRPRIESIVTTSPRLIELTVQMWWHDSGTTANCCKPVGSGNCQTRAYPQMGNITEPPASPVCASSDIRYLFESQSRSSCKDTVVAGSFHRLGSGLPADVRPTDHVHSACANWDCSSKGNLRSQAPPYVLQFRVT